MCNFGPVRTSWGPTGGLGKNNSRTCFPFYVDGLRRDSTAKQPLFLILIDLAIMFHIYSVVSSSAPVFGLDSNWCHKWSAIISNANPYLSLHLKQKRSTEGCSKFKGPETRQVQKRLVSTCKSQSGTGPGVRRSKRPLLACRTRCICSMETLHN